jgi:hypothetical protein
MYRTSVSKYIFDNSLKSNKQNTIKDFQLKCNSFRAGSTFLQQQREEIIDNRWSIWQLLSKYKVCHSSTSFSDTFLVKQ